MSSYEISKPIITAKEKEYIYNTIFKKQMEYLASIVGERKLPQAYIEFMSLMGNTNGFMSGDSCFMNEIKDLKQGAYDLLEENESKNILPDESFVFWMSQGCMFCFFNLNEGDNPPVYFYNESGEDKFLKIAHSFTEFLFNKFEMNENLFKEK